MANWIIAPEPGTRRRDGYAGTAQRAASLADIVDVHADSLGVEAEGALPSRTGLGPLVIGLDPRIRIHQVGLSNAAQDAGHDDVGHREIGAGDPLASFEAALDVT